LEVYKKLDDAGVKDTNISTYISHDSGIRDDNESMLALNLEGRTKVQQYIVDVFNFETVDGWYPGIEARTTNNRTKQPSKKSNGQHNEIDSVVSKWLSQEPVKLLSSSTQHKTIDSMSAIDKALFGLYVVHKVEDEMEISASLISNFLYKTFNVSVPENTIRTALSRALEDKSRKSYVNFRESAGYRITPTGSDYVESLLK